MSLITKGQNNESDKNAQLLTTTTRNQGNLAGQKNINFTNPVCG